MKSLRSIKPIYQGTERMAKIGNNEPMVQNIVEQTGFAINPVSVQNYVKKYQALTENFKTALPEGCGKKLLQNG